MADETANNSWWQQIIENKNGNTSDTAGITAATEAAEAAKTTADEAKATADSALVAATTVASTTELGVVKLSTGTTYVVSNSTTDNTAGGAVGMTSANELVARCATTNGNYGTVKLTGGALTEGATVGRNSSDGALAVPAASTSAYGSVKTATSITNASGTVPTTAAVYTALSAKADASAVPTNADYVDLTSEQTISGQKTFSSGIVVNGTDTTFNDYVNILNGLKVSYGVFAESSFEVQGTASFYGEVHVQDAVSSDSPVTLSQLQALIDRVAALEEAASA